MTADFNQLIHIINRLLGPKGCPWDQEQTWESLRSNIIEEVYELVEAVDLKDNKHVLDEIGDVLLNVLFFAKIAEKKKIFDLTEVIENLSQKLVRRHPHVFGMSSVESTEAVIEQWEKIKEKESVFSKRSSIIDGIPQNISALARANKLFAKIQRKASEWNPIQELALLSKSIPDWSDEDALGKWLFCVVYKASNSGLDAEASLRAFCSRWEHNFREWEHKKVPQKAKVNEEKEEILPL